MVVRDDFRGITFSPMSRHICRGWTIYGIDKYGKAVFEITDNYIKCKIPFDRKVLELSNKNVGLSVGLNDGLNKTGKADANKIDLLR